MDKTTAELMDELNLSNARAARYFGCDRHTMAAWRAEDKAPAHIDRHLDYLVSCKAALDDIRSA